MRDNYGDEIVLGSTEDDQIGLFCKKPNSGFRTGEVTAAVLSPRKARKLARKLERLADEMEADQ